jgi:Flp pilus assembly protein TadD
MAIVFLVWSLAHYHRLSPKSWSAPLEYGGDGLFVLGCIRAVSEFDFLPFLNRTISRLGAPYSANWNDFPMFEVLPIFLMGMVARWSNLISAWNVGILLSHFSSALSFYTSCRLLRFRREWSAAGALLWTFSYYHYGRSQGHLPIAFDYTVPLGIVCCWLMAGSKRFRVGGEIFWLSVLTGCAFGLGNPYNLNLWLHFVCLGIGLRFLLFRRKADLLAGALIVGITMVSFLAGNLNTLAYQFLHGQNQYGMLRVYKHLELYALKPIELLLAPPTHRLGWLADIGRKYANTTVYKGELFSPYVGLLGLGALAWMVVEFGMRLLNLRKVPRRLPSHAPLCLWVVLYAAVGGVNCFLGLFFGLMYFRGSNRFSIFITALCLLFLVSRLSRLTRRWNRLASYALAAGLAAIGLLDQLPRTNLSAAKTALKVMENDRAFSRALEERLPRGAMIFQTPLMVFPESVPLLGCGVYDHLRPYLWTKTLRFSFGSVKGRTREDWQKEVASQSLDQTVKELERYGFAGLYINRKGYEDRAEEALKQLAKCGRSELIEDEARDVVCVVLNPSPHPSWPHSDDAAQIVYKKGWALDEVGADGGHTWVAGGNASLYFVNDQPQACYFRLTAMMGALSARQVAIQFDGKTLWSEPFEAKQARQVDLRLYARPGRNYLYLTTDREPEPLPEDPYSIRQAHRVINLQIVKESDGHNHFDVTVDEKGQIDVALREYREAIRLKPDDAQAHNKLGHALAREGRTDEALGQFREAVRLKPGYAEAQNNLGVALAGKGQVDDAIRQYQEAIRLEPGYAEAHNNLGFALYTKGQAEDAIRHFQEAIRLKSGYAEAHSNLGLAWYQQGRVDDAIRQFQEALQLQPDLVAARKSLDALLGMKADSSQRSGTSTNH